MVGWRIKLEKWRDIQTFNAANRGHFAYATRLLQACTRIARRLGQANQALVFWHYQDEALSIECNGGYETRVTWTGQLVFLGFAKGNRNVQLEFQTVRVGEWIERIIALEARASQRPSTTLDEKVEAQNRSEAAFGRLPESESIVAVPQYADKANAKVDFSRLPSNDTRPSA